jgi:hypothetical protein
MGDCCDPAHAVDLAADHATACNITGWPPISDTTNPGAYEIYIDDSFNTSFAWSGVCFPSAETASLGQDSVTETASSNVAYRQRSSSHVFPPASYLAGGHTEPAGNGMEWSRIAALACPESTHIPIVMKAFNAPTYDGYATRCRHRGCTMVHPGLLTTVNGGHTSYTFPPDLSYMKDLSSLVPPSPPDLSYMKDWSSLVPPPPPDLSYMKVLSSPVPPPSIPKSQAQNIFDSASIDSGYASTCASTTSGTLTRASSVFDSQPISTSASSTGDNTFSSRFSSAASERVSTDAPGVSHDDDAKLVDTNEESVSSLDPALGENQNAKKRHRTLIDVDDFLSYLQDRKAKRMKRSGSVHFEKVHGHGPLAVHGYDRVPKSQSSVQPSGISQFGLSANEKLRREAFAPFNSEPEPGIDTRGPSRRDLDDSMDNDESDGDNDNGDDCLDEDDTTREKAVILRLSGGDLNTSWGTSSHPQDNAGSGSENSSGFGSTTSSSPATNSSLGAPTPDYGPRTDNEVELPRGNAVAVNNSDNLGQDSRPLPLLCWHKANGTPCKGQTGRNIEARRLLLYALSCHPCLYLKADITRDHSMSDEMKNPNSRSKNPNHHTLSSPCQRCGRLFEDKQALDDHIGEDIACKRLAPQESDMENLEISQRGASPERMRTIKQAMSDYGSRRTLPPECDSMKLQTWVSKNTAQYVGQSKTSNATAEEELGKWFIGWYMFFPKTEIPPHPCKSPIVKLNADTD